MCVDGYRTTEICLPADDVTRTRINDFLSGAPGIHYRQSFEWIDSQNDDSYRLFVTYRDSSLVALSFAKMLVSRLPGIVEIDILRGPVYLHQTYLKRHLLDLQSMLGNNFTSLRISPFRQFDSSILERCGDWKKCSAQRLYADTPIIKVFPTEREQWRLLRRSTRTAINKSKTLGLTIHNGNVQRDYRDFADRYNAFAKQRRLTQLAESQAIAIFRSKSLKTLLLTTHLKDRALGGILLVRNGPQLIYEWGWTDPDARKQRIPVMHGLVWHAINEARRESVSAIDLGGYWFDLGNNDPINHFKLGFSQDICSYSAEHCLVLSRWRHRMARSVRSLKSLIS
jgi:lipid II:glycine glycyltransferase (peptidoglycan interpeptide bridge formation enzyme)